MAIHKGIRIHQYLDWLVRATSHQDCLQHTQTLVKMCQDLGWLVNVEKSELEPKQVFDFVGYQFDLQSGRVRPTPNRWQSLQEKIQRLLVLPACPVRQFMSLIGLTATEKQVHLGRLYMRPIQWHLKNNWRIPESLEKVIPIPKSLHPSTFTMVAGGGQCAPRSTITPNKTCSANIYRRINRRVGRSLRRAHCKRDMVTTGKQAAYKLSGAKSSIPGSKRVARPLLRQDSPGGNRQHNGSGLCKQGRRHEVGPTLCPILENLDLVCQETSDSQGPTHPRSPKRSSRQTIQTGSDHPDRVVSPSRSFPNLLQQVAPPSDRPIRHEVQQQVASICVTGTGPPGHSSRCSQFAMGGSGRICLPTDCHIGQSGGEVTGLPVQENHPDCSGVAQHALVLGPSDHVQSGPPQSAQPVDTALQSDPPLRPGFDPHHGLKWESW